MKKKIVFLPFAAGLFSVDLLKVVVFVVLSWSMQNQFSSL